MIIACPQCDVRFVVPSTVFMNGGRKMRCASCKHVWMQDEPLEKSGSAHVGDTPDDIKKPKTDQSVSNMLKTDVTEGKFVVLIGFAIILALFFVYKFMTPSMIVGQGIAFNNIVVDQGEHGTMVIKGEIVNTMDDVRGIPSIKITNLMADNVEGDSVIFKLERHTLESGETFPIHYEINNIDSSVHSLKIMFYIDGHKNKIKDHMKNKDLDVDDEHHKQDVKVEKHQPKKTHH